MNSRVIKTVLFAGLIMTLMIPISGINAIQAEQIDSTKNTFDAEKFRVVLKSNENEILEKIQGTRDSKIKSDLNDQLSRSRMIKQLVDIKEQVELSNDSVQVDTLNAKAYKIINNLQKSFPEEMREKAQPFSETSQLAASSLDHVTGWFTNVKRNPDCHNPNQFVSNNIGQVLVKPTGATVTQWNTKYPTKVGVGVGSCSVKNSINVVDSITTSTGFCTLSTTNMFGTVLNLNCSGIKQNLVATVITQAYYQGSTNFSTAGMTFMLT